jgi:hypothetical protein
MHQELVHIMSTQTATAEFYDDSYAYNPDSYVDQGAVALPAPGNYRFRVSSLARRKDRNTGEVVMADGRWPTLVMNRIEIVEPQESAGSYAPFQEFFTKPFQRPGGAGTKEVASNQVDIIRAIDTDAGKGLNMEELVTELENLLTSGQTFVAGIAYHATDTDWAKAQIAANGGDSCEKEKKSEIWKAARLMTKDFKNPDGSYRTQAIGKSGKLLPAKLKLSSFVPSTKDVELGPYARR